MDERFINNNQYSSAGVTPGAAPVAFSAPAQPQQPVQTQPANQIYTYNSGVTGNRQWAIDNQEEYARQYRLAQQAGVSQDDFFKQLANGTRWTSQPANQPRINQYNSGVRGTRQMALDDMDGYRQQYQLAKQLGYNDKDFIQAWTGGTRWKLGGNTLMDAAANGQGKTAAESVRSFFADNALGDSIADRRLKKLTEKYGDKSFDDNFIGQFRANYGAGKLSQEYGLAWSDYMDNPTAENRAYVDQLTALYQSFLQNNQEALDNEGTVAKWLSKDIAAYIPQFINQTKTSLPYMAAGAIPGGVTGAAAGSAGGPLGTVGGAIAGAAKGAAPGMVIGSGLYSYDIMRGMAFANLLDAGADEIQAKAAANDEAIVSSIIEMGDTAFDVLTAIPGISSLVEAAGKQAAKVAVPKLIKAVAAYAGNIGQEYSEEFVQEILSMANARRIQKGQADSGISGLLDEAYSLVKDMMSGEAKNELAQAKEAGRGGATIGAVMGLVHAGSNKIMTNFQNQTVRSRFDNFLAGSAEEVATKLDDMTDEDLKRNLSLAVGVSHQQMAEAIQQEMARRNQEANITEADVEAAVREAAESIPAEPVNTQATAEATAPQTSPVSETETPAAPAAEPVELTKLEAQPVAEPVAAETATPVEESPVETASEPTAPVAEPIEGTAPEVPTESPSAAVAAENEAQTAEEKTAEKPENKMFMVTIRQQLNFLERAFGAYSAKTPNAVIKAEQQRRADFLRRMTGRELSRYLEYAKQENYAGAAQLIQAEIDRRRVRELKNYKPQAGDSARTMAEAQKEIGQKSESAGVESHQPEEGDSWQTRAKVEADESGSPKMPPKRERRPTRPEEERTWFGRTDTREQEDNEYAGPSDYTTISPLTNDPIPASLDVSDVEGYAEWNGIDDEELGKILAGIATDIQDEGYAAVFGHKPSKAEEARANALVAAVAESSDGSSAALEAIRRQNDNSDNGYFNQFFGEFANKFSFGNAKQKNVDGRAVFTGQVEGETVERTAILGQDGFVSFWLTTLPGGHILSKSLFGKAFDKLGHLLSKFGIKDIVLADTELTDQYVDSSGSLSDASGFSFGIFYPDLDAIAVNVFADGSMLHEVLHRVETLARQADNAKAQSIISSIFDSQSGLFDQKTIDALRQIVEQDYQSKIDQKVDARVEQYKAQNPGASESEIDLFTDKHGAIIRDQIIVSETLARLSGKQGARGKIYADNARTLANSSQFRQLVELAGSVSKASQSDIEALLQLYQANAESDINEGANLKQLLELYEQTNNSGKEGTYGRKTTDSGRSPGSRDISGTSGEAGGLSSVGGEPDAGTESGPRHSEPGGSNEGNGNQVPGNQKQEEVKRKSFSEALDEAFPANELHEDEAPPSSTTDEDAPPPRTGFTPAKTFAEAASRTMDDTEYGKWRDEMHAAADAVNGIEFNDGAKIKAKPELADTKTYQNLKKAIDLFRRKFIDVADGKMEGGDFARVYADMENGAMNGYFNDVVAAQWKRVEELWNIITGDPDYGTNGYTGKDVTLRYTKELGKAMSMTAATMNHANEVMSQLNGLTESAVKNKFKDVGKKGLLRTVARFLQRYQISPTNVMRMIDGFSRSRHSEGYKMQQRIDKATATNQKIIAKAQLRFAELKQMKGFKNFAYGKDSFTLNTAKGEIKLNQQQAVALLKELRTLNATKISVGTRLNTIDGFAVLGADGNPQFIELGDLLSDTKDARKMSAEAERLMNNIESNLSDVAKAYLEAANDVLDDLKGQDAATYKRMFGVDKYMYGKGDYMTLRYIAKNQSDINNIDDKINFGVSDQRFMHEREKTDGGYVLVQNVSNVIDSYINQAANYIAWAELGADLHTMDRDTLFGDSLTKVMKDNFGEEFSNWMTNYINDVNNFNPKDSTDALNNLLRKGRLALQTGALMSSVSVPIKQISSYWSAMGILKPEAVRKAYRIKFVKESGKGANNPLLQYRKVGGIDPTVSEVLNSDGLWARMTSKSKILQQIGKAIPTMDYRTVDNLYAATILDVRMDNPGMDINSEEFQQLVDNKFEEVVLNTQPIFTRNARAEYARTNNEIIKMLSMFRTQQTQNLNRLITAIGEYKASKGTINEFSRNVTMRDTIKGQATAAISLGLLTIAADILLHRKKKYDKDGDGDMDAEQLLKRLALNAAEGAAGTAWFGDQITKWAIDAMSGGETNEFYGMNLGIVSTIADVMESVTNFAKNPTPSNARYAAGYIAQTMGIPLNNAYLMLNGAAMWMKDAVGDNDDHYDDILKYLQSKYSKQNRFVSAYLSGNTQKANRLYNAMGSKAETNVKGAVRTAYRKDKLDSGTAQNLLVQYGGMESDDAEKRIYRYDFDEEFPDTEFSDGSNIYDAFAYKYYTIMAPAGVGVDTWLSSYEAYKNFKATKDEEGNTVESVKSKAVDYIASLPLTESQKAAMYVGFGYKSSSSPFETRPASVSEKDWLNAYQTFNSLKSDKDESGKTVKSKQAKVTQYINSLNLSKEQKNALWKAFGYSTTTAAYRNRPWR